LFSSLPLEQTTKSTSQKSAKIKQLTNQTLSFSRVFYRIRVAENQLKEKTREKIKDPYVTRQREIDKQIDICIYRFIYVTLKNLEMQTQKEPRRST